MTQDLFNQLPQDVRELYRIKCDAALRDVMEYIEKEND